MSVLSSINITFYNLEDSNFIMNKRTFFLFIISCFIFCSSFIIGCNTSKLSDGSSNQDTTATATATDSRKIDESYYDENYLRYEDFVYDDNIKTVLLYSNNDPLSAPILYLEDKDEFLTLSFDDLSAEYDNFSYQFIHCNADWEPSILQEQEYLFGFTNNYIDDYQYSFNTLRRYINYQLRFPNDMVQFKKSGNYILKVYRNNDPEDVIITKRFFVVEKRVAISLNIHPATLARYRDYKHEVDFVIDKIDWPILNPYNDLKILIRQNRRWDNAVSGLQPIFIKGNKLTYDYEDDNLFDAGNEFRRFNISSLEYQSINVDGIQYENNRTHVFVLPEEPRSHLRYYTQEDINGRRLVQRESSVESNVEADYARVHFTLKRDTPYFHGEVYVFGALSDWRLKEDYKMVYHYDENAYKIDVGLKQGYYDYVYAFKEHGENIADFSVVEGSHYETENNYEIFVYHRQTGDVYDRLIGYAEENSRGNLKNLMRD